ncbi:MAG: hypothetical protein DRI88_11685 [Bacteroidetes bacterium]|nr:MAG: hypothetical protein DRI88_11685 [Bacteroidota bacterium]
MEISADATISPESGVAQDFTDPVEYIVTAENGDEQIWVVTVTQVVYSENDLIPSVTKLIGNYPNPFNPETTIEFSIQNDSKIELTIFNIKGQNIKTLVHNVLSKGYHSLTWSGVDEFGKPVSSGIYYYQLKVNGTNEAVKKCLLLK